MEKQTFSLLLSLWLAALLLQTSLAAVGFFSYDDQSNWGGVCTTGDRQSPINVDTANVVQSSALTPLDFSSSWHESSSNGIFENNGRTVKFSLDSSSPRVTTAMPVGVYQFLQVHFHWGNRSGVGSEHRVNGQQSELEIHFVHSNNETTPGSTLAVISVLADSHSRPISGAWATLNAGRLANPNDNFTVSGLTLSSLLPDNRDYYHYEGSLTTPLCNETVQWFLLKDRITVPAAYLEALRSVRGSAGEVLDYNYRQVQLLGERVVQTPGSSATVTSSSLMALTVVTLLATAVCL